MKKTLSFQDPHRSEVTLLKVTELGASSFDTQESVFSQTYRASPHFNQER